MTKRATNDLQAPPMEERIRLNLTKFVAESGYSVNQIADTLGIPQASFGRYMRGENAVPATLLKPLADFFGRRTDDFFEEAPPPPDPARMDDLFLKTRPDAEIDDEVLREVHAELAKANQRLRQLKLKSTKKPKTKE